jgi:peptide/nickel transport system permease protein
MKRYRGRWPEAACIGLLVAIAVATMAAAALDPNGSSALTVALRAGRSTLAVAAAVAAISLAVGTLLGACAALGPKLWDSTLARLVEISGIFPTAVAVALLARSASPTMALLLVLSVSRSVEVARLVRGEVLRVAAEPFVLGARALGAPLRAIVRVHVWPHVTDVLFVAMALTCAYTISVEAAVGFLGLPGTRLSWGGLLGSRPYDAAAHVALLGAALTSSACYLLAQLIERAAPRAGEGLAATAGKSR